MAEQWDEFARKILPKDCPATQRIEMRRADQESQRKRDQPFQHFPAPIRSNNPA